MDNKKSSLFQLYHSYQSIILFILGFGIFLFTRMSKLVPTIPVAILISFVLILRFIRTERAGKGIWLTLLGFFISMNIGLFGLFEVGSGNISSLVFNLIRSTMLSLLYFFPFMTDRLIYPQLKVKGAISTLTFPVISTALFFFLTIEGPFEGSYQMGKFLYGPAVLKQFITLFGLPGSVFITSWFASVVNYLWENNFNWKKIKNITIVFSSIIVIIFIYGSVKILSIPESKRVKMASIVLIPEDGKAKRLPPLVENKITHDLDKRISLFENKTKIAAANGAKIVISHELAILINNKDEDILISRFKDIAKENNVYIAINYGHYAEQGKGANTISLIDNKGKQLLSYDKKYLIGLGNVAETAVFKKGPEVIQSVDTEYGRLSVCICREIDMAKYMVQAGRQNVDIMISPAYEWPKNLVISLGYMRGIEYGFSVVRASYNGITYASDCTGKILATMPFDKDQSGIMYSEVPTKGVKTLYSQIGDVFAWINVYGMIGLIVLSIIFSILNKRKKEL